MKSGDGVDKEYYGHDTGVLVDQLSAVRETGATNMLAQLQVMDVADQCGFVELVDFIQMSTDEEYVAVLEYMGATR